jgi:hypothetical protein
MTYDEWVKTAESEQTMQVNRSTITAFHNTTRPRNGLLKKDYTLKATYNNNYYDD